MASPGMTASDKPATALKAAPELTPSDRRPNSAQATQLAASTIASWRPTEG